MPKKYDDKMVSQIRMDSVLYRKLKAIAALEGRSMNGQMEFIARQYVAAYEQQHGQLAIAASEQQ